jgi:hypothetical protein
MAEPESLRQIAHSRAPLSTWLGIVLLFALFGVIVLAVIGPAPRGSDYEETRAKKRAEILKTTRDEAKALTTYGWIDKNKGVAHIPIARAMELTVAQLAQQKPTPAGPIATPEPQAPAAPPSAPAASVAPVVAPQASATPKATTIGAGPESENRAQPAGAANPTAVQPATQPGPSATPAASSPPSGQAPVSSSPKVSQSPPGTPLPSPVKTP